jgi:hypothetical protein
MAPLSSDEIFKLIDLYFNEKYILYLNYTVQGSKSIIGLINFFLSIIKLVIVLDNKIL